jgi:hypothetical protein
MKNKKNFVDDVCGRHRRTKTNNNNHLLMPLTDWSRRERRIEQRTCSAAELSELTYASICGISGGGIGGLKLSRICALVVLPPYCCCCSPSPPPSAVGKEEAIEMGSS